MNDEPRPRDAEDDSAPPPESADHEAAIQSLGARVRALRRERKQSLVELARASGISQAMLSYIERGRAQPSLKTLERLRQALGVPMTALFPHSAEEAPETLGIVVRHAARERLDFPAIGLTKQKLSPSDDTNLEVLHLILEPGGNSGDEPLSRVGEKAGLVMSGTIRLGVGEEVFDLSYGDSFQFDSSRPHWIANAGNDEARILWIIKSSSLVRKLNV